MLSFSSMSKSLSHSAANTMRPTNVRASVGSSTSGSSARPKRSVCAPRGHAHSKANSNGRRDERRVIGVLLRVGDSSIASGPSAAERGLQRFEPRIARRVNLPRATPRVARSPARNGTPPRGLRRQRRRLFRAQRSRVRAPRAKTAARRRRRRIGHVAFEHDAPRRRAGSGTGIDDSSACVYGWRGDAKSARLSAYSTIFPRYITATRVAMNFTTARSCAMKTYDRPSRACRSRSRFTTCAWIETSSADTGSSQTIEARLDRQRARDADALPLPAGKFVRIAARVLRRETDEAQDLLQALAPPSLGESVQRERLVERLADRHARIERRERVLEDDLQRAAQLAHRVVGKRPRSRPSKWTLPDVGSSRRSTSRPVVDLPQPDSPTSASVSPASTSKLTPSTACTIPARTAEEAAPDRKVLDQRVDAQQRGHGTTLRATRFGPCPPSGAWPHWAIHGLQSASVGHVRSRGDGPFGPCLDLRSGRLAH